MIRGLTIEDKQQLIDLVKQDIIIDDEAINFILDNSNKVIVFEDINTNILGFSTFRIWGKDKNKADLYTYVLPSSRRGGIGSLLYRELIKHSDKLNLESLSARIKIDKVDATSFYKNQGYKQWYVELDLYYSGSKQPESDLNFVPYEDKYFEQYAQGLRTSFYELRKTNDFQPYLCCDLNEYTRKEFLDNKDNLFLLLDHDQVIGSVIVYNNGHIDDLYVLSSYQGHQYGRKLMQFAINKAIAYGNSPISLSALEWNTRAINLYQGLVFNIAQTTHYYRLFTA